MLRHFFKRLRFRRTLKGDESVNVVNSMAKAHKLYKKLSILAHPDNNPEHPKQAECLMQRIVENKTNYANLVIIQQEIEVILNKQLNNE